MKKMLFVLLSLLVSPATAQWQTPNHSVPIGRGAGITGFGNATPGAAGQPLVSNGVGADPSFQSFTFNNRFITIKDAPYNATGDGVTNDTAAVQSAIDASCPGHLTGVATQIFPILVPSGTYAISALNMTNCNGFTMWGLGAVGNGGPIFQKIAGVGVNAVLDFSGSLAGLDLKHIYLKSSLSDGDTPYANHGILMASSAANPNVGNFSAIEDVSVAGRFGVASLYTYGLCCSRIVGLGLTQANPSNTNSYGWIYTNANIASATSAFTTLATPPQGASNMVCYRCESHAFTGGGAASGRALQLDGPRGFAWRDGILASNSPGGTVLLSNAATEVTFENTQFYTDVGSGAAYAVQQVTGSVKNLLFINNDVTLLTGGALTNLAGTFASGRIINGIVNIGGAVNNYHSSGIGTAPAATSCGTPTVTGTDSDGVVTATGTTTGCSITFATGFTTTTPACVASGSVPMTVPSASNVTLQISWSSASNVVAHWICEGGLN